MIRPATTAARVAYNPKIKRFLLIVVREYNRGMKKALRDLLLPEVACQEYLPKHATIASLEQREHPCRTGFN
jgi:hypothetical protein